MKKRLLTLLAASSLLVACSESSPPADTAASQSYTAAPMQVSVHPEMHEALKQYERKIYKVTDGVYQAVGYSAANSMMIEGDDGVIIVDVTGSVEKGAEVRKAFAEITDKPIVALVYTHNHGDHAFGGPGFVPDGNVAVYAHESTDFYINRIVNLVAPAIGQRSSRMIGSMLPVSDEGYVHYGIGPFVETAMPGHHPAVLRPTVTFKDELDVTIAGVQIKLVHAPGETDDQLFVWLPEKKVLMPGDNIYKSFPNLYTMRGTHYRDVAAWYRSIDKMRALEPEFLVPSHTLTVSGKQNVMDVLTVYRDGIQFVHDQTLRGMNQGLTPDELVEVVKLPKHLAEHPYLFEHYGVVEWSVRNIFNGYMGWYDGNITNLYQTPLQEKAKQMAKLAGGSEALLLAAEQSLSAGDYRWVLEMSDHLLRLDVDQARVKALRAKSARALGYAEHNANGRNLYLTGAYELEGRGALDQAAMQESSYQLIKAMPVAGFIEAMKVNLNPEYSLGKDEVLGLRFTDTGEAFTLHVRNGVAEYREQFPENPDHSLTTTTDVWLEIMAGKKSLPVALATAEIELEGGRLNIPGMLGFLGMFRN